MKTPVRRFFVSAVATRNVIDAPFMIAEIGMDLLRLISIPTGFLRIHRSSLQSPLLCTRNPRTLAIGITIRWDGPESEMTISPLPGQESRFLASLRDAGWPVDVSVPSDVLNDPYRVRRAYLRFALMVGCPPIGFGIVAWSLGKKMWKWIVMSHSGSQ